MVLAASLVSLIVFGPPAPTLAPEPEPDGVAEANADAGASGIEGPALPAHELPGIEFAKPPPEPEGERADEDASASGPEPSWPTPPGLAPSDGMGAITTSAILIPSAALMSWALYSASDGSQRGGVIAIGSVMGTMGLAFIGVGAYRNAKLRRWTLAYRVRATPQGGGLLTAGGIALSFGAGLIGSGILALTRDEPGNAAILLGVGGAGLTVIAPLTLVLGKRRRDHYMRTGGWYRPELPPAPTVRFVPLLTPTSAGVGVQGRF